MLVKELAALSGVKKKTLDSYLGSRHYTPSVEAAIGIAKALGVTVEFLATGKDGGKARPISALHVDIQEIVAAAERLSNKDRHIVLSLARLLKDR